MQLAVRNISKSYGAQKENGVLRKLNLNISSSEFVSIIGANGSGKSTLLRLIAGIEPADEGSLQFSHGDSSTRPNVAFLWQDYRSSNLPWLTAWKNVILPLKLHSKIDKKNLLFAEEQFEVLLPDVKKTAYVAELSGGQQQILSLVRAISSKTPVLLADEPLSALDQARTWEILRGVEHYWLEHRPLVIWVSHNLDEAILLSDRILLLSKRSKSITREIENPLPRPRSLKSLQSEEHIQLRNEIIEFLIEEQRSV